MGNREKKSTFFGGAAILAVGIAIVKLIGALYKIPLGNILDDEGFGHFNNAYIIYNLLLMVSTAGLPVALSKSISEANALGRRNQVHRTFNVALVTFVVLGAVSFAVMFLLAQPLADLQGDGMAVHAVQAIAPACFFVCVLSTFRGYAQGHSNMVPTAVSQIIEALGKLVIGLALAWALVRAGASSADAAAGAIFGVTCGAGICLIYLIVEHVHGRRSETGRLTDTPEGHGEILKKLLVIAVPITLCASVTPITSWLDTAQVQNILRDTMNAQSAQWYHDMELTDPVVAAYGAYQKAITIYNLPSSFMVAITASVIPAISACRARRDFRGAGRIAESSMRIGMLLALPAGIGLTVLSSPVMHLLYPATDHAIADPSMMLLGIASIFVCIMLVCNSVLQASGFVNLPIFIMVAGCAAKLIVNSFMVRSMGAVGAAVGTLVCYIIVAVLELLLIKRVIPAAPSYTRVFAKPMAAAGLMGVAVWAVYGLLSRLLDGGILATLGGIGAGVVVYAVLVVALKVLSREDLALMPKGDKIARLLRL
ncbi:polysaccharide biosynthesis protein [Intestinimonas sp.]|uniref:putative polysaccharide biosynthesis protein n=1 Tax=Intestinimonas sp. TaxID=1965293 RepID=UPI002624B6E5|nr:polysaccharide biosynthesis protein [Intestinimonas sp.]